MKIRERGLNFQNTGDIEMSVYLSDTGISIISNIVIIRISISVTISRHAVSEEQTIQQNKNKKIVTAISIVAIFYPFSQFCEINISLLSL